MASRYFILIFFYLTSIFLFQSCKKKGCTDADAINFDSEAKKNNGTCEYPTPYQLDIPPTFAAYLPEPYIDPNNPLTEEGVELGKKLYYDNIVDGLSGATARSCGMCHMQQYAFGSSSSAVPIMNMAWVTNFKWNGKVTGTTEELMAFEMEEFMRTDVNTLQQHSEYPGLFKKAFGSERITLKRIEYALAQFFKTMISGNSKFDNYLMNQATLTPSEISGFNIFMDESGGDCFHCHGSPTNPLWTDNDFHNNGLDAVFESNGLGAVTGNPNDNGKFKTPTLRNLAFTAPYMHDGRFNTLEEVILHYSIGLQNSPTIDPLMKNVAQGGVQLTPQEMIDLKAFLLTLTDSSYISNQALANPF